MGPWLGGCNRVCNLTKARGWYGTILKVATIMKWQKVKDTIGKWEAGRMFIAICYGKLLTRCRGFN
jgi:hypothetical protein